VYAVRVQPMPSLTHFLITFGPLFSIISWLRRDALARHVPMVPDWGFFVLVGWPVFIPWYIHRTRGPHGWPLTLLLVSGILVSSIVALAIQVLRWAMTYGAVR